VKRKRKLAADVQRQENVGVQRREVESEGKMVRQCRGMI
jgi:hypothetical protein